MIRETVLLALRNVRRNVLRSSLTILGIVIGVAAVITMVTLGSGATAQVSSQIGALGSNMLHVRPGQGFRGPGGARSEAPLFKIEDADAIAREIPGIAAAAPFESKAVQVISGNENWSTTVSGSTGDFLKVRNWPLAEGRMFTESEQHSGKAVCIIGTTVKKKLFGAQNPIGSSIRIDKLSAQVVGVLKSKGAATFGNDEDDFVLIPLRTFQRRIAGTVDVGTILVSGGDGASTDKIKADIENLLRERRRIAPGKEDNFHVDDMKEIMSTMTGTTRTLTALLGAVAAVSLLVGGIGIMNIMLVSVTERTREIGTRLAIGALEHEVLMQFLVEAVILSLFGGLFGIALGLSAAAIGAWLLQMPFILNPGITAVAFLFSGAIGIVFGYFPARQAARMNPIDALRHE
jgi:putative ABC transport system permease protein